MKSARKRKKFRKKKIENFERKKIENFQKKIKISKKTMNIWKEKK